MAQPLLLTYNLKPGTAAGLDEICRRLDIRVRAVEPGEYALPIGALAGLPVVRTSAEPPTPAATFTDEMLVMGLMMSNELDAFLKALRDAGLRIPLKAVLTPVNVAWNSADLHAELAREHSEMQRRAH